MKRQIFSLVCKDSATIRTHNTCGHETLPTLPKNETTAMRMPQRSMENMKNPFQHHNRRGHFDRGLSDGVQMWAPCVFSW